MDLKIGTNVFDVLRVFVIGFFLFVIVSIIKGCIIEQPWINKAKTELVK